MKLQKLVSEYKSTAKEIKNAAKEYNYYFAKVRGEKCTNEDFKHMQKSWKKLLSLRDKSYSIMYEYRSICGSRLYKILFACGIIKKQNSFRYIDNKGSFKYYSLLSYVNIAK